MVGCTHPTLRCGAILGISDQSARLRSMRIFMQTRPVTKEAPRYYHLILQQDLLGGWTLIREWGQQGGRASGRRDFFSERDKAETALISARDQQLGKGFQVMFFQGMDAPTGSHYEA
jgi:predicted DNA-binding WGR domain protein